MAKTLEDFFGDNVIDGGDGDHTENVRDIFAQMIERQRRLAEEEVNGTLSVLDSGSKTWWERHDGGWKVTPKWQGMAVTLGNDGSVKAIRCENPKDLVKVIDTIKDANDTGLFDQRLQEIQKVKIIEAQKKDRARKGP